MSAPAIPAFLAVGALAAAAALSSRRAGRPITGGPKGTNQSPTGSAYFYWVGTSEWLADQARDPEVAKKIREDARKSEKYMREAYGPDSEYWDRAREYGDNRSRYTYAY